MNIRKGILRLTLVLSVIVGITVAVITIEKHPYSLYEVRREEGGKETAASFRWVGTHRPRDFELMQIFKEIEKSKEWKESEIMFAPEHGDKTITVKEFLEGDAIVKEVEGNPFDVIDVFIKPKVHGRSPDPLTLPFTFLKESKHPIKWSKFVLQMAKGFASVWFIYLFVRWIVFAFIVKGFRVARE